VAGFVDDMVTALSEQLRRERAELARSSRARRFEVVSLILDSAPITRPDLPVARFADVQLVTLALQDEQRAREFVPRTLGKLADADRELRDMLCAYIGEQFSAARVLYTYRNTILNRLQRAERLLPLPLAGHGLEIGVAVEIAQWLVPNPPVPGDTRTSR
jgi:sugar diacid utilization regulator